MFLNSLTVRNRRRLRSNAHSAHSVGQRRHPSFGIILLACGLVFAPVSEPVADDFDTTIKVGGIFTQFLLLADDQEAPGEDINSVGQFNYSRLYFDSRTNLPGSWYLQAYVRLIANNSSSTNAEQAYVETGGPYGRLRVGVHKPLNEQIIRFPAPQAALAVGDEIFDAMIFPRTEIRQRDGLTFKRFVSRALGVAYRSPRLNGFELAVSYYPALNSTEGPIDKSGQSSNALDLTGVFTTDVLGGELVLLGGYFRATAATPDLTGVKAWNGSVKWKNDQWEFGATYHKAKLANGFRDGAWAVGLLYRTEGRWSFSTDYRSSNRRQAKGTPIVEYADRVMLQANYRLGPGLNIAIAGFHSQQRDLQHMIWKGKGGTVGLKVFF